MIMARTLQKIENYYSSRGLSGDSLRRALKNDREYNRLLRRRRLRLLAEKQARKKAEEINTWSVPPNWNEPREEDLSNTNLLAQAEKLDKKIENYIKNKFNKLVPAVIKKILIKIAKQ